ncbi:MAG: hypothetical protein P4M15_01755 [Alphaproteobacteria bacterium]|nr:hypothetical protein [Alphaproteobacteria bacterium]
MAKQMQVLMPLAHPLAGEPFAIALAPDVKRRREGVSLDVPVGIELRKVTLPCILETKGDHADICILQTDPALDVTEHIAFLATRFYNEHLGMVQLQQARGGGQFFDPRDVDFYFYIPAEISGRERFCKVDFRTDEGEVEMLNPICDYKKSVPYFVRQQADAIMAAAAQRPELPRLQPSGRSFP